MCDKSVFLVFLTKLLNVLLFSNMKKESVRHLINIFILGDTFVRRAGQRIRVVDLGGCSNISVIANILKKEGFSA